MPDLRSGGVRLAGLPRPLQTLRLATLTPAISGSIARANDGA
jgi:hypothetical protein